MSGCGGLCKLGRLRSDGRPRKAVQSQCGPGQGQEESGWQPVVASVLQVTNRPAGSLGRASWLTFPLGHKAPGFGPLAPPLEPKQTTV